MICTVIVTCEVCTQNESVGPDPPHPTGLNIFDLTLHSHSTTYLWFYVTEAELRQLLKNSDV